MTKIEEKLGGRHLEPNFCSTLVTARVDFAITRVDSLRQGPEGFLINLGGSRTNFVKGLDENHIIVALFGQSKLQIKSSPGEPIAGLHAQIMH